MKKYILVLLLGLPLFIKTMPPQAQSEQQHAINQAIIQRLKKIEEQLNNELEIIAINTVGCAIDEAFLAIAQKQYLEKFCNCKALTAKELGLITKMIEAHLTLLQVKVQTSLYPTVKKHSIVH